MNMDDAAQKYFEQINNNQAENKQIPQVNQFYNV